ncbi:ribonuclease P protein subunit p25-like protein [Brachionichthys hirsutus]|uniref:ribonuclease P protein subunit p25-like protein n=1 Tax=Brachionichthys hirsutus TaxID=412623 RepID=UPI0036044AC1
MENYTKARTVERPSVCPFSGLAPDTPEVRVKDGSKIRNLLRYALSRMGAGPQAEEEARPPGRGGAAEEGQQEGRGRRPCRQIVFTATGKGASKAITCAEVLKRRVPGLQQLTRLLAGAVDEFWEPREPGAGLDGLTVSRNRPAIWILLSRDPLDASQPGFQPPGRHDTLWARPGTAEEAGAGHKRKRGGGGGGGGRGRGHGRKTGTPREDAEGQA